ncbi:pectin lyase-like protein [Aspergillus homomorphus CBS 101889]|uniref:Pectin lyase-like protein n=1 Tax=Aspergillus homomorphus (strain CBS 101889) TaxID=1450537 RepID=A0A395I0Z4_ASPHC|nr:pectin lyase-like protein [Aspergillus homomorphus CBS 101889]RAL13395.1 pectin lyase-like protein [Aspergillus homomorphus CBS 101889]
MGMQVQPHIVLDNLPFENSAAVVMISGEDTILKGSTDALYFNSWSMGYRYLPDGSGGKQTGFLDPAPEKPSVLFDSSGAYYRRAKPQYESETPIVATANDISNDGTGDQTAAINSLLSGNVGSVIYFPGGVYLVEDTVKVPGGSKIIGSGWSQIMGTGSAFADEENPTVVVQVGDEDDESVIEIMDTPFTVKGATAGAVLMEWNVHESTQGSAAMWDSHLRVGGTTAGNLGIENCPTGSRINKDRMAAAMLMHVTSSASGYFENVWGWVADHDIDSKLNAVATESTTGIPLNLQTDISVYVGRGSLIDSQGPGQAFPRTRRPQLLNPQRLPPIPQPQSSESFQLEATMMARISTTSRTTAENPSRSARTRQCVVRTAIRGLSGFGTLPLTFVHVVGLTAVEANRQTSSATILTDRSPFPPAVRATLMRSVRPRLTAPAT